MAKKKKPSPMDKLTEGYEKLMKGREVISGGKSSFDKVLKKTITPKSKQR